MREDQQTKVFQIKEEADKIAVSDAILNLEIDKGKEVLIREIKISLSTLQRNAYWWWAGLVKASTGESKEEVYLRHKESHLVKIFRRDDPDFEAMYDPLKTLYKVDIEQYKKMCRVIIRLMSINDANTSQMAEFMNLVQKHEAVNNINLPDPDKFWRRSRPLAVKTGGD